MVAEFPPVSRFHTYGFPEFAKRSIDAVKQVEIAVIDSGFD